MYRYSLAAGLVAILTLGTARADYRSTLLSHNPAAYWRLNEAGPVPIADQAVNIGSFGAQNNGFYIGTAGATYVHPTTPGVLSGSSDGATTFNAGTPTGYMAVPYSASLNPGAFTAEAWFNPSAVDGTVAVPTHCVLSSMDAAAPRAGWLIYMGGDGWNLRTYNQNSTATSLNISGGGPVSAGTWYHVAVSFDGTTARLYVNGAQVASGTPTGTPAAYVPATRGNLVIGARSDGAFGAPGTAEELAVYTTVLSAGTIAAHYSAATTNGTGYAAQILAAGPVGYWRLGDPTWTPPGTLPAAINSGYLATSAQGTYQPGMNTGAAGPGYSGLGGATVGAFNGVGGYVDCGLGVPDLSAPLSSLTIMVWAKFSNFRAMDWEALITCGDSAWELFRANNDQSIAFRFGGTDLTTSGARPINDGNWHHIAATYDGAQQKIYIDGTLETSRSKTGSNAGETIYPMLIGENGQFPGRVFKGNMGEMAVFTNALSASDVYAIFNSSWIAPTVLAPAQASPNPAFEGSTVTLKVTAGGTLPLAYQWSKNGTKITGASVSSYVLTTGAVVADSGTYSVVITNTSGAATSSVVLTVVTSPPLIATQPVSTMGFVNGTASFSVSAGGSQPLSYQWNHGATPVPGGTTSSLTLANIQWGDAGTYTCTIVNAYGTTNTQPATLTVGGEFVGLNPPDTLPRSRHTALGSDGSYLYFTHGDTSSSTPFYRIPQTALTGWTSRAPLPTPSTITPDTGVNDLGFYGGSLYCWVTDPTGGSPSARVVERYDIAGDFWVTGAFNPSSDGPNSACAVINESNILGGWMGYFAVNQATDWTNGLISQLTLLPGGAVHPWDSCVGPNAVYFIKHWNVAASNGILASFTKTATPALTLINGMPFNIGMGCAIEYMPGSLFGDGHDRLYIVRGMTGTTDDDAGEQYGHWTTPTTVNQLAIYDLVTLTWSVGTLPFVIDVGSEMSLVNQTLYILAANGDPAPLKMLYLGPPMKPAVVNQPVSQTVFAGQPVTFSVGVLAGGPVNYQWRHGGTPISGATANNYSIPSAYYTDAGSYDVVVSNGLGTTNSQPATLTVLSPPLFANLTNGLVLHLKFDGDYLDSSGRANHATANGSPTFLPGKLGQAVSLETLQASGIFNFVVVGTQPDFVFTDTDSFSVSFWMNFTNWPNDLPMIGNAPNSTYQDGWVFAQDQNKIELSLASGGSGGAYVADPVAGSPVINNGVWHNFVGVIDRGAQTASVYVDGAPAGSFSITGLGTLDFGNALAIGQNPSGTYGVDGAGYFDDVGIWRRALSPTDAQSIYMVAQQGRTFDTFGPVLLTIRKAGTKMEVIWQTGTLQESTTGVLGPYNPVGGATAPYYSFTPGPTPIFFRAKLN